MLTFKAFSGINNVLDSARLSPDTLTVARDVDIGLTGEVKRRSGYVRANADAHTSLYESQAGMLASVGLNGDLTNIGTSSVLRASLGHDRIWYCDLPDGRVAFSNGTLCGLTDGATSTTWGVPVPAGIGSALDIEGALFPGDYQYQITYVRLSDGREGGPAYSDPFPVADGGVFLSGLPALAGHKINVYLTSHNGGEAFLAGSTTTATFSYIGKNDTLVLPCRTDFCGPPPAGICLAQWRSRVLVAKGNVLYASLPNNVELFDFRRDFKQFIDPITMVVPVDDGIYVGTTKELVFLAGVQFDALQYRRVMDGPVVLGSGVAVRGELVKQGEGAGLGSAMICIADGRIVAGFNGGGLVRLTEGKYHTTATEVHAHFRQIDGIPQYVAAVQ